jgi:hypothetical protein
MRWCPDHVMEAQKHSKRGLDTNDFEFDGSAAMRPAEKRLLALSTLERTDTPEDVKRYRAAAAVIAAPTVLFVQSLQGLIRERGLTDFNGKRLATLREARRYREAAKGVKLSRYDIEMAALPRRAREVGIVQYLADGEHFLLRRTGGNAVPMSFQSTAVADGRLHRRALAEGRSTFPF